MVNTFLTSSDYQESAQNLDRQRLGKQRVEALQILNLIEDLIFIGDSFDDPVPDELGLPQYDWIRRVVRKYKQQTYRYLCRPLETGRILFIIPVSLATKIPAKSSRKKTITIDDVEIYTEDRVINFGFVYHPAVQMWLGHPSSLRSYINAHIDEFIRRGYTNNMKRYQVPATIEHPPWTYDPNFHRIHKAALLAKEITRKESPWYQKKLDFTTAGPFVDYIWPIHG